MDFIETIHIEIGIDISICVELIVQRKERSKSETERGSDISICIYVFVTLILGGG